MQKIYETKLPHDRAGRIAIFTLEAKDRNTIADVQILLISKGYITRGLSQALRHMHMETLFAAVSHLKYGPLLVSLELKEKTGIIPHYTLLSREKTFELPQRITQHVMEHWGILALSI